MMATMVIAGGEVIVEEATAMEEAAQEGKRRRRRRRLTLKMKAEAQDGQDQEWKWES